MGQPQAGRRDRGSPGPGLTAALRPFWDIAVAPAIEAVRAERILEIGVDRGQTTRPLLEHAASHGGVVEAIDPRPDVHVEELERDFGDALRFHRAPSLEVLPDLQPVDVALIDGDHNWYTVHGELLALEATALAAGRLPPLMILHDVGWPYARRDLYYAAETIPEAHRHPHDRAGLVPGQSAPAAEGGFNVHLDHALHEGGERNGVLTAVEDFVAASDLRWTLRVIPVLHGLGLLAPDELLAAERRLHRLITGFDKPAGLRRLLALVESERVAAETRNQAGDPDQGPETR